MPPCLMMVKPFISPPIILNGLSMVEWTLLKLHSTTPLKNGANRLTLEVRSILSGTKKVHLLSQTENIFISAHKDIPPLGDLTFSVANCRKMDSFLNPSIWEFH